jgi:hypothetical protein
MNSGVYERKEVAVRVECREWWASGRSERAQGERWISRRRAGGSERLRATLGGRARTRPKRHRPRRRRVGARPGHVRGHGQFIRETRTSSEKPEQVRRNPNSSERREQFRIKPDGSDKAERVRKNPNSVRVCDVSAASGKQRADGLEDATLERRAGLGDENRELRTVRLAVLGA